LTIILRGLLSLTSLAANILEGLEPSSLPMFTPMGRRPGWWFSRRGQTSPGGGATVPSDGQGRGGGGGGGRSVIDTGDATRRDATAQSRSLLTRTNATTAANSSRPTIGRDDVQDARRVRKYRRAAYADLSCPSARPSDAPVFLCSSELESSRDELLVYQTNVVSMVVRTGRQKRNDSAPIQLAQCRFPGLAISNAKY